MTSMRCLLCNLLPALLLASCQASQPSVAHDAGSTPDAISAPDIAKDTTSFSLEPDPVDLHAMTLLLQARAAVAPVADSIWPGYSLGHVPLYLVRMDAKSDAVKGWLIGHEGQPAGSHPVQAPAVAGHVARFDAALDQMNGEDWVADLTVAATSTLVLTYDETRLQDPGAWLEMVGQACMERLRQTEAKWNLVAGCGQFQFPRVQEAIALLFVDVALLRDAYAEQDPKKVEQLLREWYAVRHAAQAAAPTLPARNRHYDNEYGPNVYASHRLLVAAGLLTQAELDALYKAHLSEPFDGALKDFDATMLANGWPGATALTLAIRLGWKVAPIYQVTDSVYWAIPGMLGEPDPALVETAKKRYDWKAFQARADQIMALK